MKRSGQKHNIENAFVIVLFAIFAVAVVAVLALGANRYKKLVERDNESYNKRIITSYVSAQIRNNDMLEAVQIGGFSSPDTEDGVNTLHLFEEIEGIRFDLRIYYYKGKIYELFSSVEAEMEPQDGIPLMDARELKFEKEGNLIHIMSKDAEGRASKAAVGLRCGERGVAS